MRERKSGKWESSKIEDTYGGCMSCYMKQTNRNRFKFSEIASAGLECSNWISALRSKDFYYGSFLMEAGCFRINSSVSNKID